MANLSNINNKLLVGTNGEVRIGDTATVADVKLRVKQTAQQWTAQFVNTDSSVAYGISIDTSASSYGVAGTLQCYTNTGGGFIVRNDSKVGIGTTAPYAKLSVKDGTNINLGIKVGQTDTTAVMLNAYNDAVTANIPMEFRASKFAFQNGNVGIGETSPDRKLHVNSGTDNANTLFESTDTAVTVRFKDSTGEAELECRNDWRFSNNAGANERMRISSDGNVTIGNTASVQPLTVAGNVLFRTTTADGFENRFQFLPGGSGDAGSFFIYNEGETPTINLKGGGGSTFVSSAPSGVPLVTIENNSGSTATSYGLLVKGGGGSGSGKTFEVRDSSGNTDLLVKGNGVVEIGGSSAQTNARLDVRNNGSVIEFGHTNNGGRYFGTVGSYGSNGQPFISFGTYCEQSANTFTTIDGKGNVITNDAFGNLIFQQVTSAAATGQTPVERMRIKSDGHILIAGSNQIQFYNTDQYIRASSTNDLEIIAGDDINYRSNFSRFFSGSAEHARLTGVGTTSWVSNGSASHSFGIGTTAPTTKCWVKDSQDSSLFSGVGVERSANTTGVCLNAVGGALNLNTNSSMPLKFRIQNTSMQTINTDGGRAYAANSSGLNMKEYGYNFTAANGVTVDLIENTSAHSDIAMVQISITAYHSSRTFFAGMGTFGGYGFHLTGAGNGLGNGGLTSTITGTGTRKLQWSNIYWTDEIKEAYQASLENPIV